MTNSYYTQEAQNISPIFGVSSLDEAKEYVQAEKHHTIVETSEVVLMNPHTGSVDFESGWLGTLEGLAEVKFDVDQECWIEA